MRPRILRDGQSATLTTANYAATNSRSDLVRVTLCLLAVSKVLIVPIFSDLCNFGPERHQQISQNHVVRPLEDLAILFHAFLAYLPSFQSYGGFKN